MYCLGRSFDKSQHLRSLKWFCKLLWKKFYIIKKITNHCSPLHSFTHSFHHMPIFYISFKRYEIYILGGGRTHHVVCISIRSCSKFHKWHYFHLQTINPTNIRCVNSATWSRQYRRLLIIYNYLSSRFFWSWFKVKEIFWKDEIPYSLFTKNFKWHGRRRKKISKCIENYIL